MAFTIKTQSKIASEWQKFIDDCNDYFKRIEEIANKDIITKKDKLKIKMMLEILIDEYKTLKSSMLIPSSLKEKAENKYKKVRKLYEELFE